MKKERDTKLHYRYVSETDNNKWEDLSVMSALLLEKPRVLEEAFKRVSEIDGVKVKDKELSDDTDGSMLVSYGVLILK